MSITYHMEYIYSSVRKVNNRCIAHRDVIYIGITVPKHLFQIKLSIKQGEILLHDKLTFIRELNDREYVSSACVYKSVEHGIYCRE